MELLWYFFAGVFALNAVPHFVKGVTGQTHMTPFKRVSAPVLNVAWAFANVLLALFMFGLATGNGGLILPWDANLAGLNLWATLAGALTVGLYLANFWSNPNARLPWHKD